MSAPGTENRPNVVTDGRGIRWTLRGLGLGYLLLLLIIPLLVVVKEAFFPDGFGEPHAIRLRCFVGAPLAVVIAGRNVMGFDEQRRELPPAPCIPTPRCRAAM